MANRSDLLLEVDTTLDANGDYIGDWIDTGGVGSIRVVFSLPSGYYPVIQHSADASNVISSDVINPSNTIIGLAARYFRFAADLSAGNAGLTVRASIRAVN